MWGRPKKETEKINTLANEIQVEEMVKNIHEEKKKSKYSLPLQASKLM